MTRSVIRAVPRWDAADVTAATAVPDWVGVVLGITA